jgi:hypothetical protein
MIASIFFWTSGRFIPRIAPLRKMFPVRSDPDESRPTSINALIRPSTCMLPLVGFRIPLSIFRVVLFPEPFGPTIPKASPYPPGTIRPAMPRTLLALNRFRYFPDRFPE